MSIFVIRFSTMFCRLTAASLVGIVALVLQIARAQQVATYDFTGAKPSVLIFGEQFWCTIWFTPWSNW
jgi:hypothetical protein